LTLEAIAEDGKNSCPRRVACATLTKICAATANRLDFILYLYFIQIFKSRNLHAYAYIKVIRMTMTAIPSPHNNRLFRARATRMKPAQKQTPTIAAYKTYDLHCSYSAMDIRFMKAPPNHQNNNRTPPPENFSSQRSIAMNIDQATLSQPNTKISPTTSEMHLKPSSMQQSLKQVSSCPQTISSEQKEASSSTGTASNHAETHDIKNISEADIKTLKNIDRLRLMRATLNENRRSHTKSTTQYQMRQIREVDAKEEQVIADLNRLHEKYGNEIFKMLKHVRAPEQEAVAEYTQNQKFRKHRETTLSYLPHTRRSHLRKHADQFLSHHSNLPIYDKKPEEIHRDIKQVFQALRKSKPHSLGQ
jgi:hypothetical protein